MKAVSWFSQFAQSDHFFLERHQGDNDDILCSMIEDLEDARSSDYLEPGLSLFLTPNFIQSFSFDGGLDYATLCFKVKFAAI